MLAIEFGSPVHAQRSGGVGDLVGAIAIATEDVVRRHVHQAGADSGAGSGEVARTDGVDQVGAVRIGLGRVDIGHGRTIDHHIAGANHAFGGRFIGDVEIPTGQSRHVVATEGRLTCKETADLTTCAGDHHPRCHV